MSARPPAAAAPDASAPASSAPGAPAPPLALTALAQAGMFLFGVSMALLGAVVPSLREWLALTLSDVGSLFLAMNGAMLAASLVLGLVVDRFGLKLPLTAGAALVAIALAIIGHAAQTMELVPAVVCLGFGGGLLNGGTNTLVADLYTDARRKASALNLLGVFFGIGALCAPFTLGALTARFGMTGLLDGAAGLCVLIAGATLALPFPAPKQEGGGWPLAQMPRFIRMPVVLALGFLLFFESGNEFALGGYVSTFLTRDLGMSIDAASYGLAGFWASTMLARLLWSRAALHVSAQTVLLGSALTAAAGALVMAAAATPASAIAGAVVTGFALGGVFPTVLGLASTRFHEHSGTVFGILFTIALSGGMLMPWLAGHLADAAGLRWVFVLTAGNFLAVALLALAARRAV